MIPRSIAAIFLALLVVSAGFAGSANAGDGAILLYPEDEEQTVAPGEEFEVELIVSHHGDPGLGHVTVDGEYDDSMLTLIDVEFATWFETPETEGNIVTEQETDTPGSVTATQELDPANGGVAATETFVTLTFETASDASGETTIDLEESTVRLAGATIPSPLLETNPEIIINESADSDREGDNNGDNDDDGLPLWLAGGIGLVVLAVGLVGLSRIQ